MKKWVRKEKRREGKKITYRERKIKKTGKMNRIQSTKNIITYQLTDLRQFP